MVNKTSLDFKVALQKLQYGHANISNNSDYKKCHRNDAREQRASVINLNDK